MKSKRKDTIKQRVTSRFKGLGAIMLAMFMILTGMSLMPPVEAEAATGDQYWIIGYSGEFASYAVPLFCTGQESTDKSGNVYDILNNTNNYDNGYVKNYSGLMLSDQSSLTSLGTLPTSGSGIKISPEEDTYVNVGCVHSSEDSGMLFQMKVDGTVKAETTGLGKEGKANFSLDAGTYAVTYSRVKFESGNFEVRYIVDFKSVIDSLTVTPADATLTFGGSTQTLTVSPASVADKVVWSSENTKIATVDGDGTVTPVSAGTVTIKATYTPEEGDPIVGTCTVTVNKAESTVAKKPTANNLTYNGQAQDLVTAGTAEGGTMQYAIGTSATTAPTSGWSTSIPTATNAGTYYVWYKAVGDDDHSDSDPAVVTVTISEESPAEPETDDGKTETDEEGSADPEERAAINSDSTDIRAIVSDVASDEIYDSDTVRLILNTDSKEEDSFSEEEKNAADAIKAKAEEGGLTIGSFVDITLFYEIEDANGVQKSRGKLSETSAPLTVKFPIPSGLQKSGRRFSIFRYHGSVAELLGQGSGNSVDIQTNKFSLYAIAYEDGAAPEEIEETEKKVVKPHTHTYAWDKVEATESQDGELRYQCTECYDILVRVPLSAYYVFNANTVDKINKAKQGETVKITTDRWISFHKMVFDALAARPDVSLEVSFLDGEYKGNRVSFTIPAGADTSDIFTENNFAGFMYLGNKYGLTTEEN